MTAVILTIARFLPLVEQAHGVADFMRGDASDQRGVPAAFREGEARVVDIVREGIEVGDTGSGSVESLRADDDADAVGEIAGAGLAETFHARVLGGHVDIPRREVLRDTTEDLLDDGTLGVIERRVGVATEGRSRQSGATTTVPRGTGGHVTVEIEVDLTGGRRPAVQQERVCQGVGRGRRVGGGIRADLDMHRASVERLALGVEVEVVIVTAGGAEGHGGLRRHRVALHGRLDLRRRDGRSPTPLPRILGKLCFLRQSRRSRSGRLRVRRHLSGRNDRRNRRPRSICQESGDATEGDGRNAGRRSRHGGSRRRLLAYGRSIDGDRSRDLHGRRDLSRGILAIAFVRRCEDDRQGDGYDDGPKGDDQLFRRHKQIQRTACPDAIH